MLAIFSRVTLCQNSIDQMSFSLILNHSSLKKAKWFIRFLLCITPQISKQLIKKNWKVSKPTEYNCWDTNFSTRLTVGVSSREDRSARGTGCSNLGEIWVEMQKNHVVVLSHLLNNGQACMYVCTSFGIHSGDDKQTQTQMKLYCMCLQ